MEETELKETITLQVSNGNQIHDPITINNVCRICANQNDKLIGVYTEDGRNNDLANKINTYLPIKVSESDQLPLQCCWECASTVLAWHDLVLTSVEADRRLRNCDYTTLKQVEFEQEHVSGDENVDGIDTPSQEQNMLNPKNNRIVEESVPDDRPARKKFQETNVIKQTAQFSQAPSERSPNKYNELVNADEKMCLLCKTPFKNKLSLKRHMKDIHNVQQPRYRRKKCEINDGFFCSVCDKGFTRKFDMEKHFLNKHSTLSGPSLNIKRKTNKDLKTLEKCKVINEDKTSYFKCDYCSHTFKKSSNLLRHRTIHSGIRPYCCHICGKIFRLAGNLDRHINEHHHKLKKFNCDICNKKFLSRNTRDEHMNIHTNNRPFICDTCGKAFKQAASLHIHKLFHSNIFKFTCEVCGKKFRRAQELKVHQWMHTGEKPFKCEECNVAFRSNQSLKRHLRGHGKSIECVCLICGSTFIHERYLKIHSRIHIQNTDGN